MSFYEYFQSYNNYFWQWEDLAEVIAIPDGDTIAYRKFVFEIIDKLASQGLPPFGSLLLGIIATNPNGSSDIDAVYNITLRMLKSDHEVCLNHAIAFLKLLSEVPKEYKEGKKRVLLLQAIFENCHNISSLDDAKEIQKQCISYQINIQKLSSKIDIARSIFLKDFRTLELLANKFRSVNDIIQKIASLPETPDIPFEGDSNNEVEEKNFIEQLIDDNKTFHVGSLIKRIWSGLNIPVHSALPSQQPLGGFSDITNKGEFDKLLISEFANDDLAFLSRLANNEALYIHREIPPVNNNLQRIILIDVSLKNWGTPKTIAFAIMLAIAKHPKTNIECEAYAIGKSYYPISIKNLNSIIDGLQILEGSLYAANGLAAFFKQYPANKNREIFFISEHSTIKNAAMLKTITEHHTSINYWIYTDAEGNIDVYKKQQSGKKHLQHIQLPLSELWKKEVKESAPLEKKFVDYYPILFMGAAIPKKLLSTTNGEVFQITKEKALLKQFEKSTTKYSKAWELVFENLPLASNEIEIGFLDNGHYVLLFFNPSNREIILLNITTGEKKNLIFNDWKNSPRKQFSFYENEFHFLNHHYVSSIDPLSGQIKQERKNMIPQYEKRMQALKDLNEKYATYISALKNIRSIYINQKNNLVFNIHELQLVQRTHIKIDITSFIAPIVTAEKNSEGDFVFKDGSSITINRLGMLILKSSNKSIPDIFIISAIDAALGAATETDFAGNEYYYKEPLYEIKILDAGDNKLQIIRIIKDHLGIGLSDVKQIIDRNDPDELLGVPLPITKATSMRDELRLNGATAQIVSLVKPDSSIQEQKKITAEEFFKKNITPFINHILNYGT